MAQYGSLCIKYSKQYTIGMNENGYEVGTVIDLRHLNKKRKEAAPKRGKFSIPTAQEIDQMIAQLQSLKMTVA